MENRCRRLLLGVIVLLGAAVGATTPAAAQTFTVFPVPTANARLIGITVGPDGALWFRETDAQQIGRITTAGAITEFPAPSSSAACSDGPFGITAGPDGALWFVESDADKIARIATGGAITEFPIPGNCPADITTGPDGALWFSNFGGGNVIGGIGRITTAGAITEFPMLAGSSGITAGPDGALWFVEGVNNNIGRITTAGTITEYPIPTANSGSLGITTGPDGALWFTEAGSGKIGRITTAGVFTEFPIPLAGSLPAGITTGPDGALWFDFNSPPGIGRITTAGVVTVLRNPDGAGTWGITTGPDGALWFPEIIANNIGRLQLPTFTASPTSGSAPLAVAFRGSGLIIAPTLSYTINFGDGKLGKVNLNPIPMYLCPRHASNCVHPTASFSTSHTYTSASTYTATLLNSDNTALTSATITVNSSSAEYNRLYPSGGIAPPALRDVPRQ